MVEHYYMFKKEKEEGGTYSERSSRGRMISACLYPGSDIHASDAVVAGDDGGNNPCLKTD